jgi:hypothetical protein
VEHLFSSLLLQPATFLGLVFVCFYLCSCFSFIRLDSVAKVQLYFKRWVIVLKKNKLATICWSRNGSFIKTDFQICNRQLIFYPQNSHLWDKADLPNIVLSKFVCCGFPNKSACKITCKVMWLSESKKALGS